ncbi:hypothetical protein OA610_01600 [Prochlorococcus sp. AH-716-F13]|nr:hypothetical protein [Prochlorococcus sp. AH-716-F13]
MKNLFRFISSIKKFSTRRIVLISIENFNREYAGKEILSQTFAETGYLVLLAHKSIIRSLVSYLPLKNQIYIEKGNRYGSYKYFRRAKKNKLIIYSFDEEGLMQTDFETFLKRNHQKCTLDVIDGIFSWGPKHTEILRKSGFKETQILKTGNTRFDHYLKISENNSIQNNSKTEVILICSRFASANPNKEVKSNIDRRDGSQKYLNDSKKILSLMIEIPSIIRAAKIKNKIIVRPHPSESKNLWIKAIYGLDNIEVSCKEPINDVLLRTKYLIHNRCTTAIEGFMSNIKVISYEPIKLDSPPNPDKEFINFFSNYICKSNSDLLDILRNKSHKIDSKINVKVKEFIYNLNESSSTKIVEILSSKYHYKISNNFIFLILIIFSLPVIVLHHEFFKIINRVFRKDIYAYLIQKNGKIKFKGIIRSYTKFVQLRLFSNITIYIPK